MELAEIIAGSIMILIALSLGVYASFTARKKGPILSNRYLWASKEERAKLDKEAEYKLLTIIFAGLSVIFVLAAMSIFTQWQGASILMCAGCIGLTIYAIVDTVKRGIKG